MDSLVSVLIAVYNVGDYLRDCLESVISQTYNNLDIVCVDDGSSDNSWSLILEYMKKDSRIRGLQIEHQGLPCARRTALHAAKGLFVAFIDGDDFLNPMYIEYLMRCFKYDADLACCNHIRVSSSEKANNIVIPCDSFSMTQVSKPYKDRYYNHHIWGKIYKKEFVPDHQGTNEDLQDGIVDAMVLEQSKYNVFYVNEKLYYYRDRDNSESKKNVFGRYYNTVNSILLLLNSHPQYGIAAYFAFKLALRCRWECGYIKNRTMYKDLNHKAFRLLKYILSSDIITWSDKMKCCIFCISNNLYKWIRKTVDPSMKKVEQSWKQSE